MNIKKDYFLGGGLLLLFALLTWSVVMQAAWVGELDRSVQGIIKYDTQMDTRIFEVVALLGSPPVVISLTAAICGYLWVKGRRSDSIWIGACQLLGSGLLLLIKLLVQRPRPIHQLVADTGFSFPSGHVMCSMVLMLSLLMLMLPKIKEQENQFVAILLSMIWIGMVATSRIYLRDHFASDILGSLLLANGLWFVMLPQARYIDALIVKQTAQRSAFRPQREDK